MFAPCELTSTIAESTLFGLGSTSSESMPRFAVLHAPASQLKSRFEPLDPELPLLPLLELDPLLPLLELDPLLPLLPLDPLLDDPELPDPLELAALPLLEALPVEPAVEPEEPALLELEALPGPAPELEPVELSLEPGVSVPPQAPRTRTLAKTRCFDMGAP